MSSRIKVGDTIPAGTFKYIAFTPQLESVNACGVPIDLNTDEWKGKKVVVISVPGAFTPTCHAKHLPTFVEKYAEFKAKGVDVIAVLAINDAFVMSGWLRFSGVKDEILALSDSNAAWSSKMGMTNGLEGFELKTARYTMILDGLVVKYVGLELQRGVVGTTGAEAVLAAL